LIDESQYVFYKSQITFFSYQFSNQVNKFLIGVNKLSLQITIFEVLTLLLHFRLKINVRKICEIILIEESSGKTLIEMIWQYFLDNVFLLSYVINLTKCKKLWNLVLVKKHYIFLRMQGSDFQPGTSLFRQFFTRFP